MFEFAMIFLGALLSLMTYLAIGASVARLNAGRHWREAHLKWDNSRYSEGEKAVGVKEYIEDKRAKCMIFWLPLGVWYPIKGLFSSIVSGYLNLAQGNGPQWELLHLTKRREIAEWSDKAEQIEGKISRNERKISEILRQQTTPPTKVLDRTEDGIDYYKNVRIFRSQVTLDEGDTIGKLQDENVAHREELIKVREILAGLRAELEDLTRPNKSA